MLNKEPALTGTIAVLPPEGSLLPETYKFSYGDKRQSVINRMKKAMQDEMAALWRKRAADFPLSEAEASCWPPSSKKKRRCPWKDRAWRVFFLTACTKRDPAAIRPDRDLCADAGPERS